MNQKNKIQSLKIWLQKGRTITQIQAINHFNYYRLADGIYKLKGRGMNIINLNKKGNYAKYKLIENENN
jgi:hypothetical protein